MNKLVFSLVNHSLTDLINLTKSLKRRYSLTCRASKFNCCIQYGKPLANAKEII